MTADPAPLGDSLEVHLLRYPLLLGARTTEHYDEVFRELALHVSAHPGEQDSVPARVLTMLEQLGRHYQPQQEHEVEREEAIARGETVRDMVVHVPAGAGEAGRQIDALLDETDDYCRHGELLTLAPADDVVAFRRWYLAEVVNQADARPPTPWPGELR